MEFFFFFSSRRRHTRWNCDWSSDVCSSDLSRDLRESCYAALVACARSGAVRIGVGAASRGEIDRINILRASLAAMARAVAGLELTPDIALVDGNVAPTLPCVVKTIV